jgi:hypothetical protein
MEETKDKGQSRSFCIIYLHIPYYYVKCYCTNKGRGGQLSLQRIMDSTWKRKIEFVGYNSKIIKLSLSGEERREIIQHNACILHACTQLSISIPTLLETLK